MGDYETDYMDGESAVFREKHVSKIFAALLGIPSLVTAVAGVVLAVQGEMAGAAAMAAGAVATSGAALYFAAMRVLVTDTELRVQYGTIGPTIALSDIESVEVITLDALTRLAVGPKIWPDGWRYIYPGATRGVRVRFRRGRSIKTCVVAAKDPEGLAAALQGTAAAGLEVRVEAEEGQDLEPLEAEAAVSSEKEAEGS